MQLLILLKYIVSRSGNYTSNGRSQATKSVHVRHFFFVRIRRAFVDIILFLLYKMFLARRCFYMYPAVPPETRKSLSSGFLYLKGGLKFRSSGGEQIKQ